MKWMFSKLADTHLLYSLLFLIRITMISYERWNEKVRIFLWLSLSSSAYGLFCEYKRLNVQLVQWFSSAEYAFSYFVWHRELRTRGSEKKWKGEECINGPKWRFLDIYFVSKKIKCLTLGFLDISYFVARGGKPEYFEPKSNSKHNKYWSTNESCQSLKQFLL